MQSTPLQRWSWCLFDWANSAFNTIIGTFVFAIYFQRGIVGDEVAGAALWGWIMAAVGLCVALGAPALGAIADAGGRLKPWVLAFTLVNCIASACLWFAEPATAFIALAAGLVLLAGVAHEFALVCYNAMLPRLALPGRTGQLSGLAWGVGYFGGLASLAVCLVGFVGLGPVPALFGLATENAENVRATGPFVALWFLVFALPLFLFVPDGGRGRWRSGAVRDGLMRLGAQLVAVWRDRNIFRFLIASALWRDGLATLFAVGGIYAAAAFGMGFQELLLFAIGMNVTAGAGAIAFGWLDDRFGSRWVMFASLAGLIGTGVPILLVTDATSFIVLAIALGTFVGPLQAAGRSMMAHFSPPGEEGSLFGLYAFSGKATAFAGPALFAVLTTAFDSERAGMAVIPAFLVAGAIILIFVRPPASQAESA